MEYQIGTVTYDLSELPSCLPTRIEEEPVRTALAEYIEAYTADKAAMDEYESFDVSLESDRKADWIKTDELLRACAKSRQRRKRAWFNLLDVLDEDRDYTSTEE
jgi:hypothetical protein